MRLLPVHSALASGLFRVLELLPPFSPDYPFFHKCKSRTSFRPRCAASDLTILITSIEIFLPYDSIVWVDIYALQIQRTKSCAVVLSLKFDFSIRVSCSILSHYCNFLSRRSSTFTIPAQPQVISQLLYKMRMCAHVYSCVGIFVYER